MSVAVNSSPSLDEPRPTDPWLVVQAPDRLRGQRVPLSGTAVVVGRGEDADVRLDDPYVSRTHAVLRRLGSGVVVEDLGSAAGTTVNGQPASAAVPLAPGDVVGLADVRMVFQAEPAGETMLLPATGLPPPAPEPEHPSAGAARFELRDQSAGVISNVGRDQNVSYVAHVRQERESFLREIAATRTRARSLIWIGLVIATVGFGMFAYAIIRTLARISEQFGPISSAPPDFSDFYGTPIFGIPSGLVGFGLGGIGSTLVLFGIILHVVASARRRRLDRELPNPYPTPWGSR